MSELKLQQCRLDGRYDVLDCLGRGSYSEVYVARDVSASNGSPSTVVIKALNTHLHEVPDPELERTLIDRKSTRLNSSHDQISYAVFCLKKKQSSIVPTPRSAQCRFTTK